MKFLAVLVIIVACLSSAQATKWLEGSCLGRCFGARGSQKDEPANFGKLNSYLETKLPGNDDSSANLERIKKSLDKQLTGGVRRAGQILLELSNNNEDCDERILSMLQEANLGGLRLAGLGAPKEANSRRIDKIVKLGLARKLRVCQNYIAKQVDKTLGKRSDLREFADNMQTKQNSADQSSWQALYPSYAELGTILYWLSRQDSKANYKEQISKSTSQQAQNKVLIYKGKFEFAFEMYLLEPCEQWKSGLGDLFAQAETIATIQSGRNSFSGPRFKDFRHLAWVDSVCGLVVDMDDEDKDAMLKEEEQANDRQVLIVAD